ncbi:4-hydroxy-3-methylbut-2-enyl diphosphate reductase [Treponema parvum]|uniref:4-hydroxy-3-methylbut-2-enyl diphosphate reductase n=1 Tax=Treponema parvum TaxID=138851 RepID=UPI001AEBADB9|nr:4-hydroxy-3-methylbut-2-enyl diphosphate reductase [Treponema parvum]QTQ15727.1 4-hydroxy-3-methylbut-2-enyl diphosphate reductase [Treponema parvum]
MKIIRSDVLGFCMGVCRAVDCVQKAVDENEKSGRAAKLFTMGPLIHNPGVLKKMGEQGVGILKDEALDNLEAGSVVVIRAHGVPPEIYEKLRQKKAVIKDSTCPRVKVSQRRAEEYSKKGYKVILAGDGGHGEVLGIAGFAGKNFLLVKNKEEAENLFSKDIKEGRPMPEKVILLAQTTFSPGEFTSIAEILKNKIPWIEVFNTICSATQERQDALTKLCSQVDGVLVVGGKNSANTQRLFLKAKNMCAHAALVENPEEIPEDFYSLETVGITAGASTPDEMIDAVEERLCEGTS